MGAYSELNGWAMGSKMQLIATGAASLCETALAQAALRVGELEQRWSRFIPTSEVSRINSAAGTPVVVGADTLELVELAIIARKLSGHRFDPLMLQAIKACGYDRTFVSIRLPEIGDGPGQIELGEIAVDRNASTVCVSAGAGFDPGGIGKGLAADIVATELMQAGVAGALVNLGGDIRCIGCGPALGTWVIAVGDSVAGIDPKIVELADGGIATSTCRRRRWRTADHGTGWAHHLIDPSTGAPSATAAVLVTVIAANCADAEWLATAIAAGGALPDDSVMLGGATVMVHEADGHYAEYGDVARYVR